MYYNVLEKWFFPANQKKYTGVEQKYFISIRRLYNILC